MGLGAGAVVSELLLVLLGRVVCWGLLWLRLMRWVRAWKRWLWCKVLDYGGGFAVGAVMLVFLLLQIVHECMSVMEDEHTIGCAGNCLGSPT